MASRIEEIRDHVSQMIHNKGLSGKVSTDQVNQFIGVKNAAELAKSLGNDPDGTWESEARYLGMVWFGFTDEEINQI